MSAGPVFGRLADARFVVVGGSGGVGKTTVAAALAVALARDGRRVLVVTVDPARRLGQALGLTAGAGGPGLAANETVAVPGEEHLWATMLDTKAGWDDLVRRNARDDETARRILANPLYHNITARFVNSHDYIAMEQVNELSQRPDLDLVVIDTPPSRNALDLLDAPRRMREFFGGRLLQWLTLPYRSRVLSLASRPFLQIADRLLGAQFLGDVAEFFTLLQSMEAGFVRRAREVEELLTSERVGFTVVTTAEPAASTEALHMVSELRARRYRVERIVVNRVESSPGDLAETLPEPRDVTVHVPGMDEASARDALEDIRQAHARRGAAAARHASRVAALSALGAQVAVVNESRADGGAGALEEIATVVSRG